MREDHSRGVACLKRDSGDVLGLCQPVGNEAVPKTVGFPCKADLRGCRLLICEVSVRGLGPQPLVSIPRRYSKPSGQILRDRYQPTRRSLCLLCSDLDVARSPFQIAPREPKEFLGAHSGERLNGKACDDTRGRRGKKSAQFLWCENLDL